MTDGRGPGARRHALALMALAAAVACVYGNALDGGFVLDNRVLVLENPVIRQATLANLRFILTHDYWQPMATDGLYRPLAILSFMLNYAVLGEGSRSFGYHVLNVLLHLACVGAVYALVWHLTRRRWPAVVAALLFAVHPVATEAVTNIVGRADLLATLGVLAGLLCHFHAGAAAGWRRGAWRGGLAAAAALAFFSKESGLTLVPLVLAYDHIVGRSPVVGWSAVRARRGEHLVTGSVLALYLAARWYVVQTGLPAAELSPLDNPLAEAGFWAGRLTALDVLGRELGLVVWPRVLSADYSYRQIPVVAWPPVAWHDWTAVLALVVLPVAAVVALRMRRRQPALCFLVSFAAIALVPTANLLTLTGSIMAERFLYLPLAGLAGAAALIVERIAPRDASVPRRAAVSAGIAVAVLACGWRTRTRNADWLNDVRLWSSALQASPASAKVHKAYAAALVAADPTGSPLDDVIAEGERAVAIRPDYLGALVDLGGYYLMKGDRVGDRLGDRASSGDAADWYARGVRVLERARVLQADVDRRFVDRMRARGTAPDDVPGFGNPLLLSNLSLAYVRAQRYADALAVYEEWRRLAPDDAQRYVDISAVLCNLGRWEDASIALFQATIVDPGNGDAIRRLAEVYRTFYPQGHALVVDASDHGQINLDDPAVRRHRCRAYAGLAGIYAEAGMTDAAARARMRAAELCAQDGAR